MMSWENTPVLPVCDHGLSGVAMACLLGFMAFPDNFLSCHEENDPDSKSGWDLDPDKPVWSCREDVINQAFCVTFTTNPRVVESVTGSVPVEHPHNFHFFPKNLFLLYTILLLTVVDDLFLLAEHLSSLFCILSFIFVYFVG